MIAPAATSAGPAAGAAYRAFLAQKVGAEDPLVADATQRLAAR